MKIKEVRVAARKSRNYQTYECEQVCVLEAGDSVAAVIAEAQARCRHAVLQQLELDSLQ
jgi:hypothetical protein